MAITSLSVQRMGRLTTITAVSGLSGTVYFHCYIDGTWIGQNTTGVFYVTLDTNEQAQVDVNDTNSATYDYIANGPTVYSAKRTLFWTASADTDTWYYLIEQNKNAAGWTTIGRIYDNGNWSFAFLTLKLTDLASYQFRITPYDLADNAGTAKTLAAETVVRVPESPKFTISFNDGTDKVTYTAA